MTTTYKRIASVSLTVRVLRHLADQKQPISGQQLARDMDVPTGTIMCHLATLEDEGLVRSVGEHYELGMGMALFWARYRARAEAAISRMENELKALNF